MIHEIRVDNADGSRTWLAVRAQTVFAALALASEWMGDDSRAEATGVQFSMAPTRAVVNVIHHRPPVAPMGE